MFKSLVKIKIILYWNKKKQSQSNPQSLILLKTGLVSKRLSNLHILIQREMNFKMIDPKFQIVGQLAMIMITNFS